MLLAACIYNYFKNLIHAAESVCEEDTDDSLCACSRQAIHISELNNFTIKSGVQGGKNT